MKRLEAQLEMYPGSSVSYDCSPEFGTAIFDRRCRWCARFVKTPKDITIKAHRECDPIKFKATGLCVKCGPVELVFDGFI